jgi:hypothetical protein
MKTNTCTKLPPVVTHEGGRADRHQTPLQELTRAVSTCMLFENTFYESGSEIAARIEELCLQVTPQQLAELAVSTRTAMKLRHVSLFLVRQLARHPGRTADPGIVSRTLRETIQRADELAEFLSIYWKDGKCPVSAQVKKGLSLAFAKFSEHELAKWNRDGAVKLRDALFVCHAKPANFDWVRADRKKSPVRPYEPTERELLYEKIVNGTLATPDTWEVALSGGADKKEAFTRLLTENKLGYMALLMNLRNMEGAGVDRALINAALLAGARKSKALPFRFVSAALAAPSMVDALSQAMLLAVEEAPRLPGMTYLLVDVSGSMSDALSAKSTLRRYQAAGALAILLREICEDCRIFTFSTKLVEAPAYRGLPLIEALWNSQPNGGTYLGQALAKMAETLPEPARTIVVTDEQAADSGIKVRQAKGYIVNVAGYKPALELSNGWSRISGWSERLVEWIALEENESEAAR